MNEWTLLLYVVIWRVLWYLVVQFVHPLLNLCPSLCVETAYLPLFAVRKYKVPFETLAPHIHTRLYGVTSQKTV